MGSNSLIIKDGNSATKTLSVFSSSLGFIPEHAVSGTVNVSASAASPVYVTGNVSISQPVNVDLNLSDQLTVVVSSSQNNNAVWVTSSAAYPAFVNINNTASVSISGTPTITGSVSIDGTPTITGTVAISGVPTVALQSNIVTASISGTPTITGSVSISGTASVTSSYDNPVAVTGSVNVGSIASIVSITSSYTNPVVTKEKLATSLTFSQFAVGTGSSIDWTSTGSLNMSGTFIIAQSSSVRSGLMFTNNFPVNLYVVYDTGYSNNGFGSFVSTSSAPYQYSFVLYPNGTYIADPSFVNVKHSGYFPSSSAITNQILNVYSTE